MRQIARPWLLDRTLDPRPVYHRAHQSHQQTQVNTITVNNTTRPRNAKAQPLLPVPRQVYNPNKALSIASVPHRQPAPSVARHRRQRLLSSDQGSSLPRISRPDMPLLVSRVLGPCRVSSRIMSLRRDELSSTLVSSRLSHNRSSSSRARGLRLSSPVHSLMGLLRFIRVMRLSVIILSSLLRILVNTVVRRLRCRGLTVVHRLRLILDSMVAQHPKLILVNIAARLPRPIRVNTAVQHPRLIRVNTAVRLPRLILVNITARHLRLILASTVDPLPKCTLHLGYSSNSSKNSQEEFPLTPWNKIWTGCASAPLLPRPTQVYLVLLLQMGIPMKSKVVLQRLQQQQQPLELEPQ